MNIACPHCQADVEVPEEVMRRGVVRVSCPGCSFAFVIRLGDPGPADPPRPQAPSVPIQGLKSSGRQPAAAGEIGGSRPRFVAADTRTTVVVDQRLRDEIEQTGSEIQVESRSPSRQETQLGIGRVGRAPEEKSSRPESLAPEPGTPEPAPPEPRTPEPTAPEPPRVALPAEALQESEAAEELEPELLQAVDEEPAPPDVGEGFESFRPVKEPVRPPPGAEAPRPALAAASGEVHRSPARPHPAVPYSPASRFPPILMPGPAAPAPAAEAAAEPAPAGAGAAPLTLSGTDAAALMPSAPTGESLYAGSLEPLPGTAYQPAPLPPATVTGVPVQPVPAGLYPGLPVATAVSGTVYHQGSLPLDPRAAVAPGQPGVPAITDLEVFVLPAAQAGRTARAFGLLMSVMIGLFLLFGLFVLARNNWSLDLSNVGLMLDRAFGRSPKGGQVADALRGIEVSTPHVGQARLLGGELILTAQGVVKNLDTRPRRYIYVRARLLKHGREVKQAEAPAGNLFGPELLATLDRKALQGKMNPGGRDRRNLHLEPGQNLEYMVVMFGLPPDYSPDRYAVTAEVSQAELSEGP